MKQPVGLKQFRNDGCLSYILFDRGSRQAAVIDPSIDGMDEYREYLQEHRLKVVYAIDTHIHADHFSSTHLVAQETGAVIVMHSSTSSERVGRKVSEGERLPMGSFELEILHTPGHTPDSICVRAPGCILTGDLVLIGATGRTDFPGSDPGQEWDSLGRVLGLPGDTIIFPGHDYSDLLFTTVEAERRKNPHWLVGSREKFAELKREELLVRPDAEVLKRVEFNRARSPVFQGEAGCGGTACGVALPDSAHQFGSISVEKYAGKIEAGGEGMAFIDVREPDEYRDGHMRGVESLPATEVAFHLADLKTKKRIYFSCQGGGRSGRAAKTLSYLGLTDVINVLGGYRAWEKAGLPIEKGQG